MNELKKIRILTNFVKEGFNRHYYSNDGKKLNIIYIDGFNLIIKYFGLNTVITIELVSDLENFEIYNQIIESIHSDIESYFNS